MKFTKKLPTLPGLYWVHLLGKLETGTVIKAANGFLGIAGSAFHYDWGDDLQWGDLITKPETIELED